MFMCNTVNSVAHTLSFWCWTSIAGDKCLWHTFTYKLSLFVKVWCWCSWWHSPPSHGTAPPQGWWCSRLHTPDNKRLIFAKSSKLKLKPAPHTWYKRGEYLTSLLKFIPSPVWDFFVDKSPIFFTNFFLRTFNTHLKKNFLGHFFLPKGTFLQTALMHLLRFASLFCFWATDIPNQISLVNFRVC